MGRQLGRPGLSGNNECELKGEELMESVMDSGENAEDRVGSLSGIDPRIELLGDVELNATLQFGSREMPLRDVLELGPGDVVELDRHVSEPVDLIVGDRIVARGEVVVVNGNFALRIIEVATPQLRLESIRCLF